MNGLFSAGSEWWAYVSHKCGEPTESARNGAFIRLVFTARPKEKVHA
jgi:hypothetical protein